MKHLLIILSLLFSAVTFAEEQKAVVKTRGKQNEKGEVIPGKYIDGAFVKILNGNRHRSGEGGRLSFPVSGGRYAITDVSYTDEAGDKYTLIDIDEFGKEHKYSAETKDIVIAIPIEVDEDILQEQEASMERLRKEVKKKQTEINRLVEEGKISREGAVELRKQLNEERTRNEKLIEDLSKHYATLDFDRLNEFDREFTYYIRSAQFFKADSMLHTQNIEKLEAEYYEIKAKNERGREQLVEAQAIQKENEELEQEKLLQLSDYYKKRYEYYATQFKNDSAAYYLERRAELDTTNIDWQIEAGDFIREYIQAYKKALTYYNQALQSAQKQYGEECIDVMRIYNNIGIIYLELDDYSTALKYYKKTLTIQEKILGTEHTAIAGSYNNIGNVYSDLEDYKTALDFHKKALAIREKVLGKEHTSTADSYNNIGRVYVGLEDYKIALDFHKKALAIREKVLGKEHTSTAMSYHNIGRVYVGLEDYKTALDFYKKALAIREKVLGVEHIITASSYMNIALTNILIKEYYFVFEYANKALPIYINRYGENHPKVKPIKNLIDILIQD